MITLPSPWTLHFLPVVASTSDEAKKHLTEGDIILADEQTNGRGRLGNTWQSLKGNLFCSWVILHKDIGNPALLSFISALSLGDTFSDLFPKLSYTYKWPNDVLVNGKKISGILLEQEDNPARSIIGMGVNLSVSPNGQTRYPATSLHDEGIETSTPEFLPVYFTHFSANLAELRQNGFGLLKNRWLAKVEKIGTDIEVRLANRTLIGVFKGLDDNGYLLFLPEGSKDTQTISAGEVFYR